MMPYPQIMDTNDNIAQLRERVAVLESRVHHVESQQQTIITGMAEVKTLVTALHTRMDRQTGFVAGVVFVISAVWALVLGVVQFTTQGRAP